MSRKIPRKSKSAVSPLCRVSNWVVRISSSWWIKPRNEGTLDWRLSEPSSAEFDATATKPVTAANSQSWSNCGYPLQLSLHPQEGLSSRKAAMRVMCLDERLACPCRLIGRLSISNCAYRNDLKLSSNLGKEFWPDKFDFSIRAPWYRSCATLVSSRDITPLHLKFWSSPTKTLRRPSVHYCDW